MKTIIGLLIFALLFIAFLTVLEIAHAEPLLTADPYPTDSGISAFGVVIDGGVTEYVTYSEQGGRAVVYRGGPLSDDGRHEFKVWAISKQSGRDSDSVPFLLYEKLKPLSNTGFRP
ncbi:hypothetical protein LCGC14_1013800 [marine sediment metagenome]|uniref:Uncharacterized protein n=1 Tax=marine sediment metagenome TaxID=412755 RepID=A0A0F9R5I1_9ZZZZ|nr:hypothetical protein [Candidatus Aminicenantes bacterium]